MLYTFEKKNSLKNNLFRKLVCIQLLVISDLLSLSPNPMEETKATMTVYVWYLVFTIHAMVALITELFCGGFIISNAYVLPIMYLDIMHQISGRDRI